MRSRASQLAVACALSAVLFTPVTATATTAGLASHMIHAKASKNAGLETVTFGWRDRRYYYPDYYPRLYPYYYIQPYALYAPRPYYSPYYEPYPYYRAYGAPPPYERERYRERSDRYDEPLK